MYSAESELPDIPYGLLDVLPIPYYSVGLYKKKPAVILFATTGTASHCWSGDILFKNCSRAHQSGGGVEETSQIL